MINNKLNIGVLIIGSKGAVATTVMAAQAASRLSFEFTFRLPSQVEPIYTDLGLIDFSQVVFGGWDIVSDSYAKSCEVHDIVPKHIVQKIAGELDKTDIYPAILVEADEAIEKILTEGTTHPRMRDLEFATTVFTKRNLSELIRSVEYDILDFRQKHGLKKVIIVNLASTEKSVKLNPVHSSLSLFETGIKNNDKSITAGMIYAYTAIKNGCHFVNFTPSMTAEIPALVEFAKAKKVTLTGKDGKTGQTLYKTAIAPLLKHRALKLTGWYSTNILGNRDGQVLQDPEHRATKIDSKSAVLDKIMGYKDFDHQVHIHYYKPRGDSKEAWDNIDFTGWFDVPMQMKVDWLGDDSILAAPLVFDLIRWVHFFSDKGESGILTQLASYFKTPLGTEENDYFKQLDMLKDHVLQKYATSL